MENEGYADSKEEAMENLNRNIQKLFAEAIIKYLCDSVIAIEEAKTPEEFRSSLLTALKSTDGLFNEKLFKDCAISVLGDMAEALGVTKDHKAVKMTSRYSLEMWERFKSYLQKPVNEMEALEVLVGLVAYLKNTKVEFVHADN